MRIFLLNILLFLSINISNAQNIHTLKKKNVISTDIFDLKPKSVIPYDIWVMNNEKILKYKIKGVKISISEKENFIIGLLDKNMNGSYTDEGIDIIAVDIINSGSIYIDDLVTVSVATIKNSIILEAFGKQFEITDIAKDGSKFCIEKMKKGTSQISDFILIHQLPLDLTFDLQEDTIRKVAFSDFINKNSFEYIYVDFWGSWCEPCNKANNALKVVLKKHPDIFVISLNYRDTEEEAKRAVKEWKIEGVHGYATEDILKRFHQNGFPYGALFKSNGEIIAYSVHPIKIENFIKK